MQKKRIVFGLGSNLGDRQNHLDCAIDFLQKNLLLYNVRKSSALRNPAMLQAESPPEWDLEFLNIAISADIDLEQFPPLRILEIIKEIEKEIGREDRGRWAPREIDIDILLIEDFKINIPNKLTIPHYDLFNRNFFLQTAKEIEPQLMKIEENQV